MFILTKVLITGRDLEGFGRAVKGNERDIFKSSHAAARLGEMMRHRWGRKTAAISDLAGREEEEGRETGHCSPHLKCSENITSLRNGLGLPDGVIRAVIFPSGGREGGRQGGGREVRRPPALKNLNGTSAASGFIFFVLLFGPPPSSCLPPRLFRLPKLCLAEQSGQFPLIGVNAESNCAHMG